MRFVPAREQAPHHPRRIGGIDHKSVKPRAGRTRPWATAALSRARITVVPTAMTRPPRRWTAFTRWAVWLEISNGSACGGLAEVLHRAGREGVEPL